MLGLNNIKALNMGTMWFGIPRCEADLEAINYVQHQADEGFFEDGMAGYMAAIADGAVLMPPNVPPLEGKEAMLAWGTESRLSE